ncbi:MAG: hypothetical protein EOP04_04380 [Proteobacteria bacterium]|nr:MAG: hypothetical protein EOP04_04380 [Pseudomonadota bacterium]
MLKPQDLIVAIAIFSEKEWTQTSIAKSLNLPQGEVSKALSRLEEGGLYNPVFKRVQKDSLYDFLAHGVKYVFPGKLGKSVQGIPAAWGVLGGISDSSPPVWEIPSEEARPSSVQRGRALNPIHKSALNLASVNAKARSLIAAIDSVRVGKAREMNLGRDILKKELA